MAVDLVGHPLGNAQRISKAIACIVVGTVEARNKRGKGPVLINGLGAISVVLVGMQCKAIILNGGITSRVHQDSRQSTAS